MMRGLCDGIATKVTSHYGLAFLIDPMTQCDIHFVSDQILMIVLWRAERVGVERLESDHQ